MKTLKQLLSESIRQGLPHISTMSHEQLSNLTKGGKVHLGSVTEKTDGSTFMIGHDREGFYTQSSGSGSEKMRTPQHYLDRVKRRAEETGKEPDYTGARAFADAHEVLQRNRKLTDHLRAHAERHGGETQLRGELFSRKLARPSEDKEGEVKLVGTSYDPSSWGKRGKIVIHSKLPENQSHDTEHFKKNLSDEHINFDDDKIEHEPTHVDVSREVEGLDKVNHELLKTRTTSKNKEAKQAEEAKLDAVRKRVSAKVDEHVKSMNIRPKFGSGTEGAVVHPSPKNPSAPRFKVTSDTFRAYKADPTNKEKFKKRLSEMFLLKEGGNIKVKTPEGEVSAAPFKVADRSQQKGDVKEALGHIHDAFHKEHGEHLFGKDRKGLRTGSIFGGSTRQFMDDRIGDDEFKKHKPTVGDFDVQVTHEHKDKLSSTLKPGRKFGKYTVVGMKKHGNENSAVMRHDNGEHHQFDFEGTDYEKDEPTKASQFLHSSDWEDTKAGVKGAHHKILLNAVGGSTHKFSITHGLRSRTDENDKGTKEPEGVSRTLFGKDADHSNVHSFLGVSHLIKKHIPKERHQEIYDKFKSGLKSVKADHGPALEHLRKTLGVKDDINESTENAEGHHASVIPLVGFSPFSHMGHAQDLGGSLKKLPGTKHIGISSKADVFSPDERKDILDRQWGKGSQNVHVVKGAGETIRRAYDSLPEGKKHLHILVGHDRKGFAESLHKALSDGKIKEMEGKKFDSVHLHYPEDSDRSHGMSGTKMRKAAAEGNLDEFHRHLGSSFSKKEATHLMGRVKGAIDSGKIKLVREEVNLNSNGELNHEKFGPMLDTFMKFASNKLGIKSLPSHEINKDEMSSSFAAYNPAEKLILITTKNRHPMDVFRSVAHELVHHKQNEDGRLGKDIENEGKTGSDIENEANSEAGKIMRWFAKENPQMFKSGYVVESHTLNEGVNDPSIFKAVFLAGGPGSGKDYVMKQVLDGMGLQEVNSDVAFEFLMRRAGLDFKMPESERFERDLVRGRAKAMTKERQRLALAGRRGVIINGTADDPEKIANIKKELEDMGYDTMMVLVNTSNEVSRERNISRGKEGGRTVPENIRQEKWQAVQDAKDSLQSLFGDENFVTIDNSNDLRKAPKDVVNRVKKQFMDIYKQVRNFTSTYPEKQEAAAWIQNEISKRNIQSYQPQGFKTEPGAAKKQTSSDTGPQTSELNLAKKMGLTYYGFGRYGKIINGKHTVTHISQDGKIVPKPRNINEETLVEKEGGSLSLKNWFDKSRSKDGKKGWVQVGGRYDGKPCARQPGQTSTPKCRSSEEASRMTKKEKEYAFKKKQREDPNQPDKSGAARPTMVKTYKHQEESYHMSKKPMDEEKDACYHKVKSRYDVWPSAYASGALVKCRKVGASNWGNKSKKKVDEDFESFVTENTPSDREWGTSSLTRIYREATPGQSFPVNPLFEKKKKKMTKEDNSLTPDTLPVNNGIGPEFTRRTSPSYIGFTGIQESIETWANDERTINRFIEKYGQLAEQKLFETAVKLNDITFDEPGPKFFTHLREAWEAIGGRDMGTVAKQGSKEEVSEQSSYTASRGDTASRIAKRHGMSLDDFKKANPDIKDINKIGVGQKLNVTSRSSETSKASDTPKKDYTLDSSPRTGFRTSDGALSPEPTKKPSGPDRTLGSDRTLKKSEEPKKPEASKDKEPGEVWADPNKDFGDQIRKWMEPFVDRMIKSRQQKQDEPRSSESSSRSEPSKPPLSKTQQAERDAEENDAAEKASSDQASYRSIDSGKRGMPLSKDFSGFVNDLRGTGVSRSQRSQRSIDAEKMRNEPPGSTKGSRHGDDGPIDEESPAWTRKEGKNPEGGLNKKGIESYRRANPGSKLSLAVTTPPSKLKPGSKKAKRRLSFCRRMKGMKAKLTSAKTARDPDSRINKSLRKWNCEE